MHFSDDCRRLEFRGADVIKGMRLRGHVIHTTEARNEEFCGALCFMEPNCVSYNFMTKGETGKHKCELNNSTHNQQEEDLEEIADYVYRGAKVRRVCQLPRSGSHLQNNLSQKTAGGYRRIKGPEKVNSDCSQSQCICNFS